MLESRFRKRQALSEEEKAQVRSHLGKLLIRRPEVLFAYVHGSFIKEREFRDIDVAVCTVGSTDRLHLESDLSHELSKEVGLPVEVRVIDEAPVAFQMAAVRDGLVLASMSEEARTDFIEDVGKRYRDYSHFRDLLLHG
jgi:predicted nucleotidyltransferase